MKTVDTICTYCGMEQNHLVYDYVSNGDIVREHCEECEDVTDQTVTEDNE